VGLSSSAALEVAVALALGARSDDPIALANLCQRAEHAARGVPTGILDQLSSLCGVAGHGLLLDCDALSVTPIALPPDDVAEWVVLRPNAPRDLAHSAYAQRVRELALAEEIVGPLRTVSIDDVQEIADPRVRRRACHVVTENERVRAFVAAIGNADLTTAGSLMNDSHRSLRDDFESSTATIDAIWARLVETDGVFGARITGGGWGGCVIALSRPEAVRHLAGAHVVRPAGGATVERY
jgi:galactokinase